MNNLFYFIFIFYNFSLLYDYENIEILNNCYEDIVSSNGNYLVFSNNKKLIYNDNKTKNLYELLNYPDVQDMFHWRYNKSLNYPKFNEDPGRIRNEDFFKNLYGDTRSEVCDNLKSFIWCPKLVNQPVLFNERNGALDALKKVSNELDKHPEWVKYISNIGGTFNWRKISGTNRLSSHSFGITIDLNVRYSNYWQWECNCKNENVNLKYKNNIPIGLVKIFENNGFIWGGRWYHFDTMHFEYRPELFF